MKYKNIQTTVLIILRLILGYHFLFEGIDKLFSVNWSSAGFLLQTNWLLSDFFHTLANDPTLLSLVDALNIWGQILIGLGLIIGLFSTIAAWSGAFLLFIYYFAIPPFIESFLFIDKNLIELFAFIIIAIFPTSHILGVDRIVKKIRSAKNG
ncbi:MAG: DoxX family membrane protein [Ignavibacteriales bacterium]|nr:DoxX family membrane protein [Ignavibacteriales bacterium]MCB9218360.1 DoxX family membrane protein [Ignavibacteriales bacterium]